MQHQPTLRGVAWALLLILIVGAAAASSAPDLVLTEVSANRTNASAGEQIAVSARVHNAGGLTANASRLKYYFSADATYDASDSYLNYDNVGALSAGAFEDESANVRVPSGTDDGAYHILVIADFDGDVAEIDESNTFALPITVGSAAVTDGPDLYVAQAVLGATRAEANEVVTSSCVIHNGGNEASTETRLKYYLSADTLYDATDTYLNYDAVAGLDVGAGSAETANLRVPADTPDGRYFVLFVADQTEVAHETDETNNVSAAMLLVGDAGPDLVLVDAHIPAPLVLAGETLDVSVTVRNAGDADAGDARLVYFLSADGLLDAGDKQLSFDKVDALAAGASGAEDAALRVSAATDAGSYFLLFVLDADDDVVETDEDNNLVALPVVVTGDDPTGDKADLVLSDVALAATRVPAGEQLGVAATVNNVGVVTAGASRLKYFLSTDAEYDATDTYLNYDNVSELPVGGHSAESANVRIPSTTANGSYFVLFVADETRDVAEQLESNNTVAVAFTVGAAGPTDPADDPDAPLADLIVASATVDTSAVRAGERANLHCRVENAGDFDALSTSRVKYYLSRDTAFDEGDDYVGYDNVDALSAGAANDESATPLIPALTGHGRWYLLVVADAAGDVAETFESNNVASIPIDVVIDNPTLDAPDLVAHDPQLSKSVVGAGLPLVVSVMVQNAGTQPAGESRAKLYLSKDARHDASDAYLGYRQLDPLGIGDEVELTAHVRIPITATEGAAHVLVVLDTQHALTEKRESNNVFAIGLHVGDDEGPAPWFPYTCPESVYTDASLLDLHTVASLNTLRLGHNNGKDMTALACIVSHFDLVGLVEIYDPAGVAELERAVELVTGESWSSHVSATAVGNANGVEFYAFVWRTAEVSMLGSLGFFDDPGDLIKREPYGANFRMGAFDFTFVVFHQQYGNTMATRRFEGQQLVHVYDYFQAINGSEDDVLIAGDFNLPGDDAAFTLVGHDNITFTTDPEQKTTLGYDGLANSFDNIFYPRDAVTELVDSGAHDYTMGNWATVVEDVTDHLPVWAAFDTSVDDD